MKNTFTKHTRLCLCISGAIIAAAGMAAHLAGAIAANTTLMMGHR